ncbi:MAG TPA: amidohydrolase family protein, partial [Longimicrobiales bacterium]|nr:amidohydrolase family protein [Longimicrobiales bacterium]
HRRERAMRQNETERRDARDGGTEATGRRPWGGGAPEVRGRAVGLASVLLVAGTAGLAPVPAPAQTVAVTGGTVHTVEGPTLEGATVLVRDGVVQAVGADVRIPADAERIDAAGGVVTPGLIDASTRLGLVEVGAVGETRDYAMGGDPVTAAFDVRDGINPRSTLVEVNRLGGVTTVVTRPAGGLVSGQAAVIDLVGSSVGEMMVRPRAAMAAAYGGDDDGSRGEVSLRLRELFDDARFWAENRDAWQRGSSRPLSHSRLDLEALQPVLAGQMPLVVEVNRASDIEAVLRLADEYGLDLVVEGGAEAWIVADALAEADVPVILKPLTNLPAGFDRLGARFDNAALLREAGVRVVISTFDAHNVRNLPREAGNAVRFGMSWDDALRAVTLEPARVLGIDDRYGSLAAGKVANLVVWSGDPFELSTRPDVVMIRGRVVPEDSRQRRLLERYRTLEGEMPPAYRGQGSGGG